MAVVDRVILFVVDGMRPDAMLQANAPAMKQLMDRGAYSLTARTVMPSVTLPTHMSMFHGVPPEVHGVVTNHWLPMPQDPVPGIVEVVRQSGRRAAAFYTWEPLRDLARPGSLTYAAFTNLYDLPADAVDPLICRLAADYIVRERPDFAFVYLGMPDEVAHKNLWMSQPYLDSIALADQGIAHVLDRLADSSLLAGTTCLLMADHGGHGHSHGTDCAEDMTIPWMVAGPGVKRGRLENPVMIYDTAPTIAHLLGLPIPAAWQGQVVREALEM